MFLVQVFCKGMQVIRKMPGRDFYSQIYLDVINKMKRISKLFSYKLHNKEVEGRNDGMMAHNFSNDLIHQF